MPFSQQQQQQPSGGMVFAAGGGRDAGSARARNGGGGSRHGSAHGHVHGQLYGPRGAGSRNGSRLSADRPGGGGGDGGDGGGSALFASQVHAFASQAQAQAAAQAAQVPVPVPGDADEDDWDGSAYMRERESRVRARAQAQAQSRELSALALEEMSLDDVPLNGAASFAPVSAPPQQPQQPQPMQQGQRAAPPPGADRSASDGSRASGSGGGGGGGDGPASGAPILEFGTAEEHNPMRREHMEDRVVVKPGLGGGLAVCLPPAGGPGTAHSSPSKRASSFAGPAAAAGVAGAATGAGASWRRLGGYFAVYDGHGGVATAEFLSRSLHKELLSRLARSAPIDRALCDAFLAVDAQICKLSELSMSGSTAQVAFIECVGTTAVAGGAGAGGSGSGSGSPGQPQASPTGAAAGGAALTGLSHRLLHVANVGDAQAVLAVAAAAPPPPPPPPPQNGDAAVPDAAATAASGSSADTVAEAGVGAGAGDGLNAASAARTQPSAAPAFTALDLTVLHTGRNVAEVERVTKAGGYFANNMRVCGGLAVTRAFGDASFKRSGVIAAPYQQTLRLNPRHKFLILACDGVWDVMTPTDAVGLVWGMRDPDAMAERIIGEAMRRNTLDNISVVVVRLHEY
jgi:serine/threonine protein phosphatase PrpC